MKVYQLRSVVIRKNELVRSSRIRVLMKKEEDWVYFINIFICVCSALQFMIWNSSTWIKITIEEHLNTNIIFSLLLRADYTDLSLCLAFISYLWPFAALTFIFIKLWVSFSFKMTQSSTPQTQNSRSLKISLSKSKAASFPQSKVALLIKTSTPIKSEALVPSRKAVS